jgi:hypothetical protein
MNAISRPPSAQNASPVRLRERRERGQADRVLVEKLGGVALSQPGPQFPGALAGVGGKYDEEPVGPDHVGESLRALQRDLPSGAHLRQPFPVIAVLSAQQHGAERAKQVVPWCRPTRPVRAESLQRTEPRERPESVSGGDDVVEGDDGKLVGGQHAMLGDDADDVAIALGQPGSCLKHRLVVSRTATRAPRDGRL